MADLQDIKRRRANINHDLEFQLNYVAPLSQKGLEKAKDAASRVSDYK